MKFTKAWGFVLARAQPHGYTIDQMETTRCNMKQGCIHMLVNVGIPCHGPCAAVVAARTKEHDLICEAHQERPDNFKRVLCKEGGDTVCKLGNPSGTQRARCIEHQVSQCTPDV